MHLSYIIAVVASVAVTVSAISDSQQFERSSVVTTNAEQAESVVTTSSEPDSSKRSLRVQEQEDEDEEENGEATTDGDDSEQRLFGGGNFLSSVGVNFKTRFRYGATVPSPEQAALQKQPELLARVNTLKMKTGARAESLSVQHAVNVASAMKKADPERIKNDKYMDELFQRSKAAKGLKGGPTEAISQERQLASYRKLLDDKDMTADKFRAIFTRDSPMADEALGAADIIYSRLVIDRLRKSMSHYSVDSAVSSQSKEAWKAIEGNPVALTHFGRLMDDPTKLNDVIHELGKVKGGDDAGRLIIKAISFFGVYNLKKLEHLKLVKDVALKREETVSTWLGNMEQFHPETWNLRKMKEKAGISATTKRDDIKYDMLNGLIGARLSKSMTKEGTSFDQQTEIIEVISLLEKNKLAQKFLPEAVGGKDTKALDKLLHVGNSNLDAAKRAEVEEASKLLGRIHDLSKKIKF